MPLSVNIGLVVGILGIGLPMIGVGGPTLGWFLVALSVFLIGVGVVPRAWSWFRGTARDETEAQPATKPEPQETASASTEPPKSSVRRFNNRVRQKFLNLYMERSERLQKENEQLNAEKHPSQEKGRQSNDGEPKNTQ
jgi:hypothetical protein